jgi:hypothetical protein
MRSIPRIHRRTIHVGSQKGALRHGPNTSPIIPEWRIDDHADCGASTQLPTKINPCAIDIATKAPTGAQTLGAECTKGTENDDLPNWSPDL